jgi:hypothetical protein
MPSRAAAVRELLKRGLAVMGFEAAPAGTKSRHFGVIAPDSGEVRRCRWIVCRCCALEFP